MEERGLAALIAALVSHALLSLLPKSSPPLDLLLLSPPLSNPNNNNSNSHPQFLPLFLNLNSISQIAVTTSFLSSTNKKRKRQHQHHHRQQEEGQQQEPSSCGNGSGSGGGSSSAALIIPLPNPNPDCFKQSLGMSSSTFEWLSGLLDPLLDCRDPDFCSSLRLLNSPARLAVALYRLASGAPYPDIARRFAVSEPAARFCTKRLCRVLCTNFRFWIAFPSSHADLISISDGFRAISNGLPDCCGAIASARFGISGGRYVAAQIVADASSRIISIAAGFNRNMGDDEVLQSSSLYKDVGGGKVLRCGQYLVGDGGYHLLPWLMVPFANAAGGSIEEDFNDAQRLMCRPVKRALSSLKNWGVMSRLMEEEDGKMAVACIGTCAILHNVLLMREDISALSAASMENSLNVEKCSFKARVDGLAEECGGQNEGFELRRTLATKARAARNSGQES